MPKRTVNNINLDKAFLTRKAQVYALAGFYAAEALLYFQNNQMNKVKGKWWTNRTYQAAQRFFAKAFEEGNKNNGSVGFFIAHGVEYGKDLTLKNNRAHDAMTPIIKKFAPKFLKDVQELYKD